MKVLTVLGTRPEIIRLSCVIKQLDQFCEHVLLYSGQNFDPKLSDIFFRELGVRQPDINLGIREESFSAQLSAIIAGTGEVLAQERPDRVLILGDTNTGLAALTAARMGIPVYHMEAGNRCYDDRVPEEVNRRVIDHCSEVLLPYTHRSKENLLREGIERQRIFVVGNPIYEVLKLQASRIDSSGILHQLGVAEQRYLLATLHRVENVDDAPRLKRLLDGLALVADTYREPVVVSLHPRTRDKMSQFHLDAESPGVHVVEPLGFFDFVKLEKEAHCVLSDSGTVQEECCIFGVPSVTLRDVTERAETIECGGNILSGASAEGMLRSVEIALGLDHVWRPPSEYVEPHVASTVAKVILGHYRNATRSAGDE